MGPEQKEWFQRTTEHHTGPCHIVECGLKPAGGAKHGAAPVGKQC